MLVFISLWGALGFFSLRAFLMQLFVSWVLLKLCLDETPACMLFLLMDTLYCVS